MKYIMIEQPFAAGMVRQIPIIFPKTLVHDEVFDSIKALCGENCKPVSAGEISLFGGQVRCGGNSETLKISSRGAVDEEIIKLYDYQHGLIELEGV